MEAAHPNDSSLRGNKRIGEQSNENFIIFIHAQQSGLYRIHLRGRQSRYG